MELDHKALENDDEIQTHWNSKTQGVLNFQMKAPATGETVDLEGKSTEFQESEALLQLGVLVEASIWLKIFNLLNWACDDNRFN